MTGAEVMVTLQVPEPIEMQHKRSPSDIRPRQKVKIVDSEKQSIGYETMTTVSDLDPEVSFSMNIAKRWKLFIGL